MTTVRELITELEEIAAEGGDDLVVALCNFGPALEEQGIYEGPIWSNRGAHAPGRISPDHPGDQHIAYIDFDGNEEGTFR